MNPICDQLKQYIEEKQLPLYSVSLRYADGSCEDLSVRKSSICKNSYSVAKLFVVSAIGLLYDQNKLSTEDKVLEILGDEIPAEILARVDERWHSVTVDTVLLHGLALPGGFLDIDCSDPRTFGEDYLSYLLTYPLCGNHGQRFTYTDGAYYLLARCVEAITRKRLDAFLWEHLFAPLSFREVAWSICPRGHCMGATGLYISTEDMAKLGRVYLDGGRFADRQILSPEWVRIVFERGYELRPIKGALYGKGGMLGQMLALLRDRDVAVAWHGYDDFDGIALLDQIHKCIEQAKH